MVDERIRLKGINTKGALFGCVQLRLEIMRFLKLRIICGITAIIEINNIKGINDYNKFVSEYTTDDEYLQYVKARIEELKPYAG